MFRLFDSQRKGVPARERRCGRGAIFVALALFFAVGTLCAVRFFSENADTGTSPSDCVDDAKILRALTCEIAVREGDLIMRHGNGLWSDFIRERNLSDKRFSHVGIIVRGGNAEAEFFVIHADCDAAGAGAVRKEPLADFLREAKRIGVFRPRGNVSAGAAAKAAETFLGRPFDRAFNLENDDELYCTELIFRAFREADPNFTAKTITLAGREIVPADAFIAPELADELFDSAANSD